MYETAIIANMYNVKFAVMEIGDFRRSFEYKKTG
jgi:hypothetical protein